MKKYANFVLSLVIASSVAEPVFAQTPNEATEQPSTSSAAALIKQIDALDSWLTFATYGHYGTAVIGISAVVMAGLGNVGLRLAATMSSSPAVSYQHIATAKKLKTVVFGGTAGTLGIYILSKAQIQSLQSEIAALRLKLKATQEAESALSQQL